MSIEGQGHFLTLAQGHVHTKIQTGFSQKLLCRSEPNCRKVKTVDFSETIAASDLKIGRSRHLNECMKVYEY